MDFAQDKWILRNIKRGVEWSNGTARIVVKLKNNTSEKHFELYLYPDIVGHKDQYVVLYADLNEDKRRIRIVDLLQRGADSQLQGKHYGTLLVNLVIQFCRILFKYKDFTDINVAGETYTHLKDTDPNYTEDIKRRSYFWSRFGFAVKDPIAAISPMSTTLDQFKCVYRGEVSPGLDTLISLNEFYLPVNRPRLPPSDISFYKLLLDNSQVFSHYPTQNQIQKVVNDTHRSSLGATLIVGVLLCSFSVYVVIKEQLNPIVFAIFIGLIIGLCIYSVNTFKRWLITLNPSLDDGRVVRERELAIAQITKLLQNENGVLFRIYKEVITLQPEKRNSEFDHLSVLSQKRQLTINDTLIKAISNFLLEFSINDVYSAQHSRYQKYEESKDFVFGTISMLDVHSVNRYIDLLGKEFPHHLDRLLSTRYSHTITVNGNTNAKLTPFLSCYQSSGDKDLNQIAYVQLYSSGRIGLDFSFLHLKMILRTGIIDYQCDWCAWREGRLSEMVDMLQELFDFGLISRTYIQWEDELKLVPDNIQELLYDVLDLIDQRVFSDDIVNNIGATPKLCVN